MANGERLAEKMDGQVAAAAGADLDRGGPALVVADDRFPGDEPVEGVLDHQPVTTLAKTFLHDSLLALYRTGVRVSYLLTERDSLINKDRTLCQLIFYILLSISLQNVYFQKHNTISTRYKKTPQRDALRGLGWR
jgi:hypothetical protein